MNALARKEGAKAFHLYIDECSLFLNDDIGYILDLCRKYGLHLTMAHQHLGQLRDAGEKIYRSVLTDAKTKVIFGGLEYEDADVMVKNVFMGDVELQERKSKLTKPTVVGYNRTWFENYAKSKGYSFGTSVSEGSGSGMAMVQGSGTGTATRSGTFPHEEEITNTTTSNISQASSTFQQYGKGTFEAETESEGQGASEGLEPIFKDLPVESYTFEEQIWRRVALMVNQDVQHAIIKLPDKKSVFVKTPTVKAGFANEGRIKRFKEQNYLSTYCIKAVAEAKEEIETRGHNLLEQARTALMGHAFSEEGKRMITEGINEPDFGDNEPPPDIKERIIKVHRSKKNKSPQ